MFNPQELSTLYDISVSDESIRKFLARKVYSCFWPDGQLHSGPAPLIRFTEGTSINETILPNPFYIRKEKLHWLAFASLCKKHFQVSGICFSPSNIEITPALYDPCCDILLRGRITLLI